MKIHGVIHFHSKLRESIAAKLIYNQIFKLLSLGSDPQDQSGRTAGGAKKARFLAGAHWLTSSDLIIAREKCVQSAPAAA
jgi:hypothetical protein